MYSKAIKIIIIAMTALMLAGAYPMQAFAMDCAENSDSSETHESSGSGESSESSDNSGDTGSSESVDSSAGDQSSDACGASDNNGDDVSVDAASGQDSLSYEGNGSAQDYTVPENVSLDVSYIDVNSSDTNSNSSYLDSNSSYVNSNSSNIEENTSSDYHISDLTTPDWHDSAQQSQEDKNSGIEEYQKSKSEDTENNNKKSGKNASSETSGDAEADDRKPKSAETGESETESTEADDKIPESTKSESNNQSETESGGGDSGSSDISGSHSGSMGSGGNTSKNNESAHSGADGTNTLESASEGDFPAGVALLVSLTGDSGQNNTDNDSEEEAEQDGDADVDASISLVKTSLDKTGFDKTADLTPSEEQIEDKKSLIIEKEEALEVEEIEEKEEIIDLENEENNEISYIDKFIYNDQKYILGGGESLDLSELLAGIGLEGEITDVNVSDESLFSVTNENGTWTINSHQPFDTEEWMKVTIDGVEYEIEVTDDLGDPELVDISGSVKQSDSSSTMIFLCSTYGSYTFNIRGKYGNNNIQTTFSNSGYQTAIKVGSNEKRGLTNFKFGKVYEFNGVQIRLTASLEDEGRAVAIKYEVHNKNAASVNVKFGSSADTMLDDNDLARVQFEGNTIVMENDLSTSKTYGAKYMLYPSEDEFTTKWRGRYDKAYDNMFNNFEGETPLINIDSGIAWSWTANLQPYQTVTRSAEFGVYRNAHKVTFYGNGGTPEKTIRGVSDGSKVTAPSNSPVKNGYKFKDWYEDQTGYNKFDFDTPITADKNLYAGWELLPPEVDGPANLTLEYGYDDTKSISVSATAADDATLSYEWYSCAEPDEDGTLITGETESSYHIPTGMTIGNYYYYCKVSAENRKHEKTDDVKSRVATVTVKAKNITITAVSDNKTYDGTPLTNNNIKDDVALVDGDKIESVTVTGSRTNAGSSSNVANNAVIIRTADGADVTNCYNITYKRGTLTVDKLPLTITADSAEKEYDGTPLTKNSYTYEGQLAQDETIGSVIVEGSQTDYGSSDNVPSAAVIMHDGRNVTANYNIEYENGKLTVNKRSITITADSNSKVYDGTPLTKDTFTYGGNELASGDSIESVTIQGSQTDVGSSDNIPKAVVIRRGDDDVTESYNISFINGILTVNKRPFTITADSAEKVYDGTPLTKDTYTYDKSELVEGDTLTSVTVTGSQTTAGTGDNKAKHAVIKREDKEVTGNYEIRYVDGKLTVTKRTLTITADSDQKIYDGTPLTKDTYTYDQSQLAGDDVLESVTVEGSRTNVGSSENIAKAAIIKNGDVDITDCYLINYVKGTLIVNKRPLTITADSAEKVYDGLPLTKNTYSYEKSQVANGDTIDIVIVEGSRIYAGEGDNIPEDAVIKRGSNDVTGNYEITYNCGTLTVTRRPITITADSAEKVYDATPLTKETYSYDESELAEGDSVESVLVEGSRTDVGTSENKADYAVITRAEDNNSDVTDSYNITYVNGTLTVTKAEAEVVAPDPNNRTYDGTNKPLVTGGSTDFGYIEYALGTGDQAPDEGSYSREIPEGKNAGEYKVWYRVQGTDNYTGVDPTSLDVTIAKAAMSVESEGYTGEYDGNGHSIKVDVSEPQESVVYYSTSELNDDNFREGSTDPIQRTEAGSTKVYFYVYSDNYEPDRQAGSEDIVINPKEEPNDNGSDGEHSNHYLPNPDALHAWYLVNDVIVHTSKIGKATQGFLAADILARARNFLLNEAFSFDLTIHDKAEYTLKKGKIVMYIPDAFQKKGRVFAVLGLDKCGNVHLFTNVGKCETLLEVNVDFEGYAFDLVYIDA